LAKLEELAMVISLLANKVHVKYSDGEPDQEVDLQDKISRFVLQLELFNLKAPEEWGEEERKQYKEYFDEEYGENKEKSPELTDITEIMDIMKMELRIDQLVNNEIVKDSTKKEDYRFTKRMLNHREQ